MTTWNKCQNIGIKVCDLKLKKIKGLHIGQEMVIAIAENKYWLYRKSNDFKM